MSRPKGVKNRDLPPNLTIKKGIYYYTNPLTGKSISRGKSKALAITEAIQANLLIYKPKTSLIDWVQGNEKIKLHDWIDSYQEIIKKRNLSEKSLIDYKVKIGIIRRSLPNKPLTEITTQIIADFIHNYPAASMAKNLKANLVDIFNEAISSGHISNNPASLIRTPKIKIQRTRLTLDQFKHVLYKSPIELKYIFLFSVLTGQRIGDITSLKWKDIKNDRIYITQGKTGSKIAIPLNLKLDIFSISVGEVISKFHQKNDLIFNISDNSLRRKFKSYLPKSDNAPTFHEIRSLSARLWEEEKGSEFASKLLGHKSLTMTSKYLDNRNGDYIEL